jgi:hypothetical protein
MFLLLLRLFQENAYFIEIFYLCTKLIPISKNEKSKVFLSKWID